MARTGRAAGRKRRGDATEARRPAPATKSVRTTNAIQTFHATVQVTRVEDWCVEADSAAQARLLLANGDGERCRVGECLYLEVTRIDDV